MKNFDFDRKFIENKYHKTNEPFDSFNRMAYHGYPYDESTGLSDGDIISGLDKLSGELSALPHPIAKAKAIKYVLDNTMIDVNEHDYFVGFWSVNRLAGRVTQSIWDNEVFKKIIPETGARMNDMNKSGAISIWPDYDHVIPNWDSILALGFPGLRRRAAEYREMHRRNGTLTPEADAHFEGIDIIYGAISDIVGRMYEYAKSQTHEKSDKAADCLLQLRDGAPTDIYEAMQLIFIYFIISESFDCYQVRSLGHGLDSTLCPYYKNDIESGRYTRNEIKELLKYFLFQWSAIGNYWGQPFYMGGTDKSGNTKYNELSEDILDIYDEIGIYNPKVQIKVNRNTPEKILFKVFDMIRRGQSCFVFCCEPGFIKSLTDCGVPYEDAWDFDISGCYETRIRANEVCSGSSYINMLKAVEYTFTNGYEKRLCKRFGCETGELSELLTFDDFYRAFLEQSKHLIDMSIKTNIEYESYLSYVNPSLVYSATIEGSLKKGVDAYQCGTDYNNDHVLCCGIGTTVDALMAVKEFVYDKKLVTLKEMKEALDSDWKEHEELRTAVLKSKHKYGNADRETDRYAAELSEFYSSRIVGVKNSRGGIFKATIHSARQFISQGLNTPATPDGRYAGQEISKNASPTVGMDKNGVTALISSALALNPPSFPESFCVDVMLHPTAISGEEGLHIMKALLMTYLEGNGLSIQFNVFGAETLHDAQRNPDKYKNLQVRVCGWNVLWNNMSKKEQDAYILRAENIQ